jgi:membrane fusion protein (multidrug efflux system)
MIQQDVELEPPPAQEAAQGPAVAAKKPASTMRAAPADAPAAKPSGKAPAKPLYQRTPFLVFLAVVALVVFAGTIYWLHARNFEETDDAFIDGHVIAVTPQVSARVVKVNVNDNQLVHAGDVLVELDTTDFDVALQQAQGAQAAAAGRLEQARAGIPAAQSQVTEAQAMVDAQQVAFDNADRDLKRYLQLDERAKSQQAQDNATAAQKTAAAQLEQARAHLQSAQSQLAIARASVMAAEGDYNKAVADTRRAQVNLDYCHIRASVDGRITMKSIDVGSYVTPSNPIFSMVPLDVWVTANFKETQLDLMRAGQPVSITVDAYPDLQLTGKVDSIQMGTGSRFSVIPAENATGNFVKVVQRVPVKIVFDNPPNHDPNQLLAPGMSVYPSVRVREGG